MFSFCEGNQKFSFLGQSQNFSVNFYLWDMLPSLPSTLCLWLDLSSVRTLTGGMQLLLKELTKQEKSTSTPLTPWISCYMPFCNLTLQIKLPWKVQGECMTKTKFKAHVYEQLPILPQFECWKYFCFLFHDLYSVKNTEVLLFTHHKLAGRK